MVDEKCHTAVFTSFSSNPDPKLTFIKHELRTWKFPLAMVTCALQYCHRPLSAVCCPYKPCNSHDCVRICSCWYLGKISLHSNWGTVFITLASWIWIDAKLSLSPTNTDRHKKHLKSILVCNESLTFQTQQAHTSEIITNPASIVRQWQWKSQSWIPLQITKHNTSFWIAWLLLCLAGKSRN